jgi:hypothetical protein
MKAPPAEIAHERLVDRRVPEGADEALGLMIA